MIVFDVMFQTSRLLQVIAARRAGDEVRVERLLTEHRDQRKSGRGKCATNSKRRRVLPTQRMRDYVQQQVLALLCAPTNLTIS